jgi:hypothetical protein
MRDFVTLAMLGRAKKVMIDKENTIDVGRPLAGPEHGRTFH